MDWTQTIKEGESTLLHWYRLITQSGHGHIEVIVNESSNTIDIQPTPKIRSAKEQQVFRFEKRGGV